MKVSVAGLLLLRSLRSQYLPNRSSRSFVSLAAKEVISVPT